MKKVLLLLCLSFFILSCEKEEDEDCNCGVITDDEIIDDCYSLTIMNDCSGNYETFCFSESVWFDNYVGDNFCVTNVDSW